MPQGHRSGKLAVILHADVVGSTTLVQRDEHLAHDRIQDTFQRFAETIKIYHGNVRELRGDALLAEFARASDAASAAIVFQAEQADYIAQFDDNILPAVRVGISLGEVVIADNTVTGAGVVLAQRVEQLAAPGGVCITAAIHEALPHRMPFERESLGEQPVKGFDELIKVYAVSLRPGASIPGPESTPTANEAIIDPHVKPSIAILPFENMSSDPEQVYFSDGISEDIITDLSKVSGLHVVARNSSFVFKGSNVNIKQAARELGVRYVLEGSVRKWNDRVRITAQLIDSTSGGHLWAERYDRVLDNIFDLQDEIAGSIVSSLRVELSTKEERALEVKPTKNVGAYEAYLRGRSLLRELTHSSVKKASGMFEKAIAIDPNYVQALSGLADCGSTLLFHYGSSNAEAEKALDYCRKALEIDPKSAEAHASHGRLLEFVGKKEEAAREYESAIELAPEYFEAHYYFAAMYLTTGQAEKSVPLFQKAFSLAELDLQTGMMLMLAYESTSRKKELGELAGRVLEIARLRNQLNPDDEAAAYVGAMALYYLDETEEAVRWAELAVELVAEDSRSVYNLACLLSLLRQTDQAIDMVAKALKAGCSESKKTWIRDVDNDMANIRQDPRFQSLFAE